MRFDFIEENVEIQNGETIFYRQLGHGPKKILMIHGNFNSSINWDLLMESLPQENYTMIALDLRGFGHSSYVNPIERIKDFSEDIKLFLEKQNLTIDVVMGWSAGGAVALQFAADYPALCKNLILLSSASIKGFPVYKRNFFGKVKVGQYVTTKQEMAKQVKLMVRATEKKNATFMKRVLNMSLYKLNKPSPDRYEKYVDEMLMQRNLADINYALVTFNISNTFNGVVEGTNEVERIVAKTLIIQGDQDKIITEEMATTNLKALRAELVTIKNCGHVAPVDNLIELKSHIEKFINT